jgi:hypothetical protein
VVVTDPKFVQHRDPAPPPGEPRRRRTVGTA